ncbi:hypothetical protein JJV70_15930 [Streptomyces sp. JJ66]|uniref:hypothetical protein n=1 Tax=Streptomyces sp. JJ66 TaxID=2803843 RepID=UPI001C582698|nr:hypothetical protein [Streptomyces sp. JJ66]MBW1603565.1 hypothetical protein [Streptomyces sp. JJ66]
MPRPADDLFDRYMQAFQASETHTADCHTCQRGQPCESGTPLHQRFARLQDAWTHRQSRKQP